MVDTLDALAESPASTGTAEVVVCGEICLPIHHWLLGRVSTSSSLSDIQHVYSHPQALGQCKLFLTQSLPNAELHEAASTSRAAELVARNSVHTAAIASKVTAVKYQLDILAENIEDREDNATRFLVLRRSVPYEADARIADPNSEAYKRLLSFSVDHEQPGTLVNALKLLPNYGLNLTSIHSRPSPDRPWQYVFFIEFKTICGEGAVNKAWSKLISATKELTWLGTWVDPLDERGE